MLGSTHQAYAFIILLHLWSVAKLQEEKHMNAGLVHAA